MTVIMKVNLVGPRQHGPALGSNEFAGYCAKRFFSSIDSLFQLLEEIFNGNFFFLETFPILMVIRVMDLLSQVGNFSIE
jgi:hypothetical protein